MEKSSREFDAHEPVLVARLDHERVALLAHREDVTVVGPRRGRERSGPRRHARLIGALTGLGLRREKMPLSFSTYNAFL